MDAASRSALVQRLLHERAQQSGDPRLTDEERAALVNSLLRQHDTTLANASPQQFPDHAAPAKSQQTAPGTPASRGTLQSPPSSATSTCGASAPGVGNSQAAHAHASLPQRSPRHAKADAAASPRHASSAGLALCRSETNDQDTEQWAPRTQALGPVEVDSSIWHSRPPSQAGVTREQSGYQGTCTGSPSSTAAPSLHFASELAPVGAPQRSAGGTDAAQHAACLSAADLQAVSSIPQWQSYQPCAANGHQQDDDLQSHRGRLGQSAECSPQRDAVQQYRARVACQRADPTALAHKVEARRVRLAYLYSKLLRAKSGQAPVSM